MTDDLNLNDPNTLKAVLSASVTDVPPSFQNDEQVAAAAIDEKLKPAEAIKERVEAAQKTATYTTKFNADELSRINRMTADAGFTDWKEFLSQEIRNKLLHDAIAKPRISKPSWAKTSVIGPSGW
jgi:hypothetical protein